MSQAGLSSNLGRIYIAEGVISNDIDDGAMQALIGGGISISGELKMYTAHFHTLMNMLIFVLISSPNIS